MVRVWKGPAIIIKIIYLLRPGLSSPGMNLFSLALKM
jgi:hypothetical protein